MPGHPYVAKWQHLYQWKSLICCFPTFDQAGSFWAGNTQYYVTPYSFYFSNIHVFLLCFQIVYSLKILFCISFIIIFLHVICPSLPYFYGLHKTHKPGVHLHPIISLRSSISYPICCLACQNSTSLSWCFFSCPPPSLSGLLQSLS